MIEPDAPLRSEGDLQVRSARSEGRLTRELLRVGAQIVLEQQRVRHDKTEHAAIEQMAKDDPTAVTHKGKRARRESGSLVFTLKL